MKNKVLAYAFAEIFRPGRPNDRVTSGFTSRYRESENITGIWIIGNTKMCKRIGGKKITIVNETRHNN